MPHLRSMDHWWVRDAPFSPELGELGLLRMWEWSVGMEGAPHRRKGYVNANLEGSFQRLHSVREPCYISGVFVGSYVIFLILV